ncbi:hypothetical protein HYC85_012104 [Camellia sinensis]|uniref:Terpene synthase metal-binding domain-containing protein n=1 Tax=Camellia sinensis TaxID=4442 RepID=A0A7J7HD15_CAMSI|nr:hypothetical protein HYC85_012104 [Camellia sinensis]
MSLKVFSHDGAVALASIYRDTRIYHGTDRSGTCSKCHKTKKCHSKNSFVTLSNVIKLRKCCSANTFHWADLCKAFLVEAKWCFDKETPTFEAYLENAWRSVSGVVILVHAYFLMTQTITKEALDSLQAYHSLLECSSIIFRLTNDLGTSKLCKMRSTRMAELERGESANSILCHMKENGVSEQFARKHISNFIDETWKKMNKDQVIHYPFEKSFVETTINLARISQCTYQHEDRYGSPDSQAKNQGLSVIIESITLIEKQKASRLAIVVDTPFLTDLKTWTSSFVHSMIALLCQLLITECHLHTHV